VDLASMARSPLDATAIEASSMGLHIEAELSPAVVGGDGALLDRMVAKLVENAVRSIVQGLVASCLDVTIQP
jgi:signal transduction histidine kinase